MRSLEASRQRAYGALSTQVEALTESQDKLRTETAGLVKALRSPSARGRWGEMQLRRALEMAGMLAHCDFVEQPTVSSDDGVLRPDVVVRLPGGKNIVVDAKVPLEALLDAFETDDDAIRDARYQDFLRHVRDHMGKLSLKAYWRQFTPVARVRRHVPAVRELLPLRGRAGRGVCSSSARASASSSPARRR